MGKAGETENDAGFLKHIASQTAVVIHSPLSLDYSRKFFGLHIYGISKRLLMLLTHTHTATARVSPHMHSTCSSYVLCAYLYCVYALVGEAISIRYPYIRAIHESVPANCTLSSAGTLFVQ